MTSRRFSALAVVVLYHHAPEHSRTITSLLRCAEAGCPMPEHILVFDNASDGRYARSSSITRLGARYQASSGNVGVAGAYEAARRLALEQGIDWLWLFDQDSDFEPEFAEKTHMCLGQMTRADVACAAILPKIFCAGQQISPTHNAPANYRGMGLTHPGDTVIAINSGMLVRRAFVDALGGFDARFWLDGLDHWLCLCARSRSACFAISGARMDHDLSVMNKQAFVSRERYISILTAEGHLFQAFYQPGEKWKYLARLLYRCAKHVLMYRRFDLFTPSARQFGRLLLDL